MLWQELLQPWEMRISLIWEPPTCSGRPQCANCASCDAPPPPPGARVWGPPRGAGWEPVGITVDEDTLPHTLTFTTLPDGGGPAQRPARETREMARDRWLDLPF
jgi:hypothetical protein